MKSILQLYKYAFVLIIILGCTSKPKSKKKGYASKMQSEDFEDIVKFLSSDELKGRLPGTVEMKYIEDYTIKVFKKYNIEPIQDSYLQNVPIKGKNKPYTNNIWGKIMGVDDKLKNEFVILCAHYDHLGTTDKPINGDSVYNGARDNALGVAALIKSAIYYSKNIPKRSVIFALLTAEEQGLLGSKYMADNLPVGVNDIVFVYNVDGAGYNDTSKVTFVGTKFSNMEEKIFNAVGKLGITPIPDPVPALQLFKRSDNYSFTLKGIPSITISQGFDDFDSKIEKYYHQLNDEYDTLDFKYLNLWLKAYISGSEVVINSELKPDWLISSPYKRKM